MNTYTVYISYLSKTQERERHRSLLLANLMSSLTVNTIKGVLVLRGTIVLLLLTYTSHTRGRADSYSRCTSMSGTFITQKCARPLQAVNLILEELDAHSNKE